MDDADMDIAFSDEEDNGEGSPRPDAGATDYAATEESYNQEHNPVPQAPPAEAPAPRGTRDAPEMLRDLWERWFPGRQPGEVQWSGLPNLEQLYQSMGIDPSAQITQEVVNEKFKQASTEAAACINALEEIGELSRNGNDAMLRLVLAKIAAARQLLLGSSLLCQADTMQPSDLPRDEFGFWRFLPPDLFDDEKPSPKQHLIMYALDDCMKSGFRRYREWFMIRITTPSGKPTCAWAAHLKIADYVRSLSARRLTDARMWFNLTTGPGVSALKSLTEYLTNTDDPEIPWLEPDRHVFSFRNGVYLAKDELFISYDVIDRFYGEEAYPVACKHFDMDFNPAWLTAPDPMMIPTPAMDSIFELQHLSPAVQRWAFALFGRLLYNVREFDDWQIFPFLKGLANTGKSTLLNYIKRVYDGQDVATISNMVEKQFGLGQIAGKFIGIGDDVRSTFQMDQSDFQNMASGNAVPVAVKHKDAHIVDPWTTPILFSGNEVPDFHDNSGSYGRRMAVIAFNYAVEKPDGSLSDRLYAEIAAFIAKINRQYRNMVRRFGHKGIWTILPEEFKNQRAELTATSNALIGFLSSSAVRKGRDLYMPLDVLRAAVMEHANRNNLARPHWGGDYYRGPLTLENLHLSDKPQKRLYPRNQVSASKRKIEDIYVYGIDLAANCIVADSADQAPDAFVATRQDDPGPQRKRQRPYP